MSTVDLVEQRIRDGLLRGDYPPGTWLRQDDLAAGLGVSKIPVREALQRLAAASLVTFEANRGANVRGLTKRDAEEVFTLRLAFEPELLRRAIGRHTIVDLATAELALADEGATLTESNWRFHRALYAPADWSRALRMVETLNAAVAPYVLLYTAGLGGAARSDAEHRELLEHCRRTDARSATRVLREHLRGAADAVIASLS
ncbi:MAG TPA: GntR family transcriptional regulator [Candidatus Limnocylindrales bacterium]|nr:GntR family transcriptional regulator [Candidatus Limnocylindrales bacterium]